MGKASKDLERLEQSVKEITLVIDSELKRLGGKRNFNSTYPLSQFISKANYLVELGRDLWRIVNLQESSIPSGYREYPYRVVDERGYFILYSEDFCKWISEHRYVLSLHLGRKLESTEIVHHKDHDKLNNKIDNLLIMSRHDHSSYHGKRKDIMGAGVGGVVQERDKSVGWSSSGV